MTAGKSEVEAAHIYPNPKNGADDVRNGLALCHLHHWAFDIGWVDITEDYEIIIYDDSSREKYQEFQAFNGEKLQSPGDVKSHPKYLRTRQSNVKEDR